VHTPGPWKAITHAHKMAITVYGGGCYIADVDTSAPDPGENEANARLIAQAPAMHDILARLCRAQERISGDNPLDGLLDDARTILRTIEGG
jgi:hypothetical protein